MLGARARLALLNMAVPLTKTIGKVHAPFAHRLIQDPHVHDAAARLRTGQVLVSGTRGELTNAFIPGDYTHAAVYVGHRLVRVGDVMATVPCVVEAVSPNVRPISLTTFLLTKDRVLALQPLFAVQAQMEAAATFAIEQIGLPYDFLFEPNRGMLIRTPKRKAFYCAELAYDVYRETVPSMPFTLRATMGVETVTPQDFVNATKHWQVAWDSKHLAPTTRLELITAA